MASILARGDGALTMMATPVAPKPWLSRFTVDFTQLHILYEIEQPPVLGGRRLQFSIFIDRAQGAFGPVDAKIEVFDDEWPRF